MITRRHLLHTLLASPFLAALYPRHVGATEVMERSLERPITATDVIYSPARQHGKVEALQNELLGKLVEYERFTLRKSASGWQLIDETGAAREPWSE